jgi:hypothetical protein
MVASPSVVIDDLDIEGPGGVVRPLEAEPPLAIDADAELPAPVSAQRLEMVAGQAHEVEAVLGVEQDAQALRRLPLERLKCRDPLAVGEPFGALVALEWRPRAARHGVAMAQATRYVKRSTRWGSAAIDPPRPALLHMR